jgi:hypothetical protein
MTEPRAGANDATSPASGPIATQLRIGLVCCQLIGLVLFGYGIAYVVNGFKDSTSNDGQVLAIALAFMLLPGPIVFFTAASARRRHRAEVVSARLYGILTGVFTTLASIPLVLNVLGLLGAVVGLFTLTAALLLRRQAPEPG